MADKDQLILRVSWVQPLLTAIGMFTAVVVAVLLMKSDIRDVSTIQRLEKEKQALIDAQQDRRNEATEKTLESLTNRLDRWTGLLEKSIEERNKRTQPNGG